MGHNQFPQRLTRSSHEIIVLPLIIRDFSFQFKLLYRGRVILVKNTLFCEFNHFKVRNNKKLNLYWFITWILHESETSGWKLMRKKDFIHFTCWVYYLTVNNLTKPAVFKYQESFSLIFMQDSGIIRRYKVCLLLKHLEMCDNYSNCQVFRMRWTVTGKKLPRRPVPKYLKRIQNRHFSCSIIILQDSI